MSLDLTQKDKDLLAKDGVRDRTCYVSGPMRGYEDFNFAAFDQARDWLEKRGWFVYSPADLDRFDGAPIEEQKFEECMRRDYTVIARSGAMFLMRGWQDSTGANAELAAADIMKLNVYEFEYEGDEIVDFHPLLAEAQPSGTRYVSIDNGSPIPVQPGEVVHLPDALSEVRIVDPTTGGAKGQKMERFDLIPADALRELARVYGVGSLKYEDRNWEKGYRYGLSFGAMQRHAWAFWNGQDIDPDPATRGELYHLAQVAWHALGLLAFRLRGIGTDDRGV